MALPVRVGQVFDIAGGAHRLMIRLDTGNRSLRHGTTGSIVRDLSTTGFWIETDLDIDVGTAVSLGWSGLGVADATVACRQDRRYQCTFLVPLTRVQWAAALAGSVVSRPDFTSMSQGGNQTFEAGDAAEAASPRWPGWVRLAIVVAGALLSWAMVVALGTWLF